MRLSEIKSPDKITKIKQCYAWALERLGIEGQPKLKLSNDQTQVDERRTFGSTTSDGNIWVHVGNRNSADVMRTLVHELAHFKQFEDGSATDNMDEQQRLAVEDEANAVAGRLMREYGQQHVEIYESRTGSLQHEVADSLPQAFVIPGLNSSNPYQQYKFGTAIAAARGAEQRKLDDIEPFHDHSLRRDWADNEVVISFDPHIEQIIDAALKDAGVKGGKRRIGAKGSKESPDVPKSSPVKPFKGY
jgi:hypothetical protein